MIYKMMCVRDRQIAAYGQPFCVTHVGSAIRSFSDELNNGKNELFNKHPEDFDLYELGDYDDDSGSFTLLPQPRQVAIGKDLRSASSTH